MKSLLLLMLLVLGGQFTACEPEDWLLDVDCNECFGSRPDSAQIIVNLSINPENMEIPVTVYKGDAGDEVEWQDTAYANEYRLVVAVGPRYTVRARYRMGDQIIEAFDTDEMVLRDYGESCGDPCYILKGGIYELQLAE